MVTLKHWDAYSLENSDGFDRHNFDATVSNYGLATTYFPAFRQSVVGGDAKGVMCSYNSLNGVPTCASPFLRDLLRGEWGFDGYMTSGKKFPRAPPLQHPKKNAANHPAQTTLP